MPDAMRAPSTRAGLGSRLGAWRAPLLLVVVLAAMAVVAPRFASGSNAVTMLKAASTHLLPATGFTLVLIAGALDLSIAAVMTMGGMAAVGLAPTLGTGGAVAAALALGAVVGLVNGLLVTRARIDAFIVTLGTMTVVLGLVNIAARGGTVSSEDFAVADWLDAPSALAPRVLLGALVVAGAEAWLRLTPGGRALALTGGNRRTAWFAGISTDAVLTRAFLASGLLSALGGAVFALSLASANPALGAPSLMLVIAATIIGGTSLRGGRGSVAGTAAAVLALVALTNGLSLLGAGYEAQLLASGSVLAAVVLVEAAAARRAERWRGARPWLLHASPVPPSSARGSLVLPPVGG
jgi:ribose transport system permease protein